MSDVRTHLRGWAMPHVLCAGCGHGIVLRAFLEAVDRLGIDPDSMAMVAGIGCSSRVVGYVDFCTLHATHGRAPAFATGLKLARPELNVVVVTGDGDGLAIGGNHLIHAARRNLDITCLLFNNAIYGMTGGQGAPTTPPGSVVSTAPQGSVDPPFDACSLLTAAGASFVARVLAARPTVMTDVFSEAMLHHGFSFIEVISDCPEYFGRYNHLGGGAEMLAQMTRNADDVAGPLDAKRFVPSIAPSPAALAIETGILHRRQRPVYEGLRGERDG